MNKKKFFNEKVKQVLYSIWDLEFKIAKSRQVREGVRLDRDRAVETVASLENNLKTAKKEDKERIEKEIEKGKADIRRYERQMELVDNEINGIPAQGENPGQNGLLDMLRSYAELREMYKDYAKKV